MRLLKKYIDYCKLNSRGKEILDRYEKSTDYTTLYDKYWSGVSKILNRNNKK